MNSFGTWKKPALISRVIRQGWKKDFPWICLMRLKTNLPAFIIFVVLAGLPAAGSLAITQTQRRPSVVLVILDAVRADRIGPYGYLQSTTPALNRFAKEAVVFENAYANSNWTGASIASMLTGRRPFSHGLLGHYDVLPESARTIQAVMSENGYETAAFFTGLPGEPQYGLSRGFDHIEAESDCPMSRHVSEAIEWKRKLPPEKDFFILLHGNDAHNPYSCPGKVPGNKAEFPEVDGDFILYYNDSFPGWDLHNLDPVKWEKALSYRGNASFLSAVSDAYDRCVSREDGDISLLLHGLDGSGERPLLVIITADHGELLGEHGFLGHGWQLFEPLVRIPLLIRFPGRPGGQRIRAVAEHVDLLPTICQVVGIACPGGLDGKDLPSAEEKADKPLKWSAASGGGRSGKNYRTVVRTAAFSDNGKKISLSNSQWKLFDLAADPGETRDVAGKRPAEFLKLASDYLVFSGAESVTNKAPYPEKNSGDCFQHKPALLPDSSADARACSRARLETSKLARAGDFDAAAAQLAGSDCSPADKLRGEKVLNLVRRAITARRPGDREGYGFSTFPGRWEVQKDGFTVIYSKGEGFECKNDEGLSVAEPVCIPLASAMLNCIEKYRFDNEESNRNKSRNHRLEEALKKAGYLH
ncbi:MAG: sulfatase [bacterium]